MMIYWHVEEVELILTSWHQCCDTFIPSDDPLDIDTFSEEFDLRMRSHHQIQNYLSWTIVFRFGRGPSSTCSTIPRPTFSTSTTSNPPAQPSLQRPGSAAPHLQVSPEDQIHDQIHDHDQIHVHQTHVKYFLRWSTAPHKRYAAPIWSTVGDLTWSQTGWWGTTLTRWVSRRSLSQIQVIWDSHLCI